jgi:hypothetical protein
MATALHVCVPVGAQQIVRTDQFAYAIPVILSGSDALNYLDIPQAVYEGVVHADLTDLRVVNAGGEPVPHALKPRPGPESAPVPLVDLPYFPLTGSRDIRTDQLEIRTERSKQGTIVRVIPTDRKTVTVLRGYLVDTSALDAPLKVIELEWRSPDRDYIGSLRVEGSDDLRDWRTLTASAPLLTLSYGGRELARKSVELPGHRYPYLRLSWPAGQPPLELTELRGRRSDVRREPVRQWKLVASRPGDKAGEYRFEAGGRMPVDRLRVALPGPNTLVSVRLLARDDDDQPWQTLTTAVLYRLTHDGQEVTNPDLAVRGGSWRQWLLTVDQRGGGLGDGTPTIEVGWIPQQLVFVARGAQPFELVYGNARARSTALPIPQLVPGWRSGAELKAQPASVGVQRTLAGPRVLEPRPDYKVWALWASLVLGVAILAWMAWQLAHQLRASR